MTAVNQGHSPATGGIVVLAILLLLVGLLRLAVFTFHEPLLAYANNYDMARLQACHQVWPADPAITPGASTPTAPIRLYSFQRHANETCFFSSELLFTTPALWLARAWGTDEAGQFSLRWIGATKAGCLALVALLASWWFYRAGATVSLLAHAAWFAGVMTDPGVTLYLHTFYSEFAAAFFLYSGILGLWVLALDGWRLNNAWWGLLSLMALGLSKPQHVPLAMLVGVLVAAWLLIRHRLNRLAMAVLLSAVLPLWLSLAEVVHTRDDVMARVNKTDLLSLLLATTPAQEQPGLLARFQLPPVCQTIAGKSWHQLLRAGTEPCPEAQTLDYARVAGWLLLHPAQAWQMMAGAVPKTQRWLLGFYGQVESQPGQQATEWQPSVVAFWRTFDAIHYSLLFCLPMGLVMLRAAWCLSRQTAWSALDAGFALLAVMQWGVLAIAVLGDGYVELPKHTHLAGLLLLTQLLLWPAALFAWARGTLPSPHSLQ